MPIVNFRGLGSKGVIKDVSPFDLPLQAFSDSLNVRFNGTHIIARGGHSPELANGMPEGFAPLGIIGLPAALWGDDQWILPTASKIYQAQSSGYRDITRESGDYKASTWDFCLLPRALVLTCPEEAPQGLNAGATEFADLPGWGKSQIRQGVAADDDKNPVYQEYWRARLIRSFKSMLIALNTVEDMGVSDGTTTTPGSAANAVAYPQRVRWSDVAQDNLLPSSWNWQDTTGFAGYIDLTGANGEIVEALPLGDYLMVYTTKETWVMQYIGSPYVFQTYRLYANAGAIAQGCAIEYENGHFVIAADDVYVHNGSERRSIAFGTMRNQLISLINDSRRGSVRLFVNNLEKEVWICYSTERIPATVDGQTSTFCDKAACWNWSNETWSFYDLPDVYGMALCPVPDKDDRTWEVETQSWEETEQLWRNYSPDFAKQIVMAASQHGAVYSLENGRNVYKRNFTTGRVESAVLSCYVERTGLDMDDAGLETFREKWVQAVYPQFDGIGDLTMRWGGQTDVNQPVNYVQAKTFDIGKSRKLDFRVSYRYLAYRIEATDGQSFKISGFDAELKAAGRR